MYYLDQTVRSLPEVDTELLTSKAYENVPFQSVSYEPKFFNMPVLKVQCRQNVTVDERMANALAAMMQALGENQFNQASANFASLAAKKLRERITAYLAAYKQAYQENEFYLRLGKYFRSRPEKEAIRCEQELHRWMTEERAQFETFLKEFRDFVLALAKDPPSTGSGLSQPRKRTQVHYLTHPRETITIPRKTIMHPQRTYADIENEIANQLVGLPPYTALVKLATKGKPIEHTLQTLDPKKLATKVFYGVALQDRIARIQAQNRKDGYTRPRQDVEDEITKRQTQCSQQTQQPPLQPQPPHRKQILTCQKCGATNPQGARFCNQCGNQI